MTTLIFHRDDQPVTSHVKDAEVIVERLARLGYQISLPDAYAAWKKTSSSMASEWLDLPSSDELLLEDVARHCDQISVE